MHLLNLRDTLELRRWRLLGELDELLANELHGRVAWHRRDELVDDIERLIQDADAMVLRELSRK
jgi:hypothetical protein